jgi:peptidoglycan DL-endopeptidase LytE
MKKVFLPICAVLLAGGPLQAGAEVYKVRKGDSLSKIARSFQVELSELKQANGLSTTQLKPGMKLTIPTTRSEGAQSVGAAVEAAASVPGGRYTVRKGDNLFRISQRFQLTVDELAAMNHLEGESVQVGQELLVTKASPPKAAPASISPEVALRRAARAAPSFAAGAATTLQRGVADGSPSAQTAGAERTARSEARPTQLNGRETSIRVTVKRGDTLNSLASKYAVSAAELRALNGLRANAKLKPGMSLVVRGGSGAPTYVVRRGDTLSGIAQKFRLNPRDLARRNGLGSRGIFVGQKLVVGDEPMTLAGNAAVFAPVEYKQAEAALDSDLRLLSEPAEGRAGLTDRLISVAKRMIDIPYKFGGNSSRGIDCSAYVQKVFRFLNMPLPRTAREQFTRGVEVPREELASGDLVFFRTYARFPSHVGIYLGNNQFIHASSVGKRVKIDSLDTPFYSKRFIGAKRLVEEVELDESPSSKLREFEPTAG